jgi:hypothetical protein
MAGKGECALLTREELDQLIKHRAAGSVSLYQPSLRQTPQAERDKVQLKSLLDRAQRRLEEAGWDPKQAAEIVGPGRELVAGETSWQERARGGAVFAAPGFFRAWRLPVEMSETLVVGERFHLKPLLPLFSEGGSYYLLALSQNRVRLLAGDRYGLEEIDKGSAPDSLAEALRYDDPERSVQQHAQKGGGRSETMFHGQGITGGEQEKEDLLRFCRAVNRGISQVLAGREAPLLVAAVEHLLPIYREANTYPHLLDQGVTGNPDEASAQQLHQKAWPLLEPVFQAGRRDAEARFHDQKGTGKASSQLDEVLAAAGDGRVDFLFAPLDRHLWGSFDPQARRAELVEAPGVGVEDLTDLAACLTLQNGGAVYAVESEEIPDGQDLAAVFRY